MFYLFTLVSFLALYVSAFSFGALVFQFIQRVFSDSLMYGGLNSGMARYSIASLIVAFPLYMVLMRLIWRETKGNEKKLESGIRKWFIYITLVGVAGVMLGDLIAVVYNALGGELAVRFVLKACTIFAIAGAIFWYYLFDLRRKAENAFPKTAKIFAIFLCALVIASIAYGIYLIGGPTLARAMQFDQRRISDLQQISYAVEAHWNLKGVLPNALDDLKNSQNYYIQSVTDPKTSIAYEYRTLNEKSFELCAVFETDSARSAVKLKTPVAFSDQQWNHGIGRVCFQREAQSNTPAPTPKPKGVLEVSSPCTGVSAPVCGEDKKTYASECLAQLLGIKVASQGICPTQVSQ